MSLQQTYDVPLVSTNYACHFFKFLSSKGITEEAILTNNSEAKRLIDNPNSFISVNQTKQILEIAQSMLNDEKAAFEFGQQLDLGVHGLFGYSLLSSEDLPQLVETVVKHMRICIPLFDMEVIHSGRDVIIRLNDSWDVGTARSFIVKMYMGSIYRIASKICSQLCFDLNFSSVTNSQNWASLAPNSQWNFDAQHNQVTLLKIKQADQDDRMKVVCSLAENRLLKHPEEEQNEKETATNITAKVREHISKSPRLASLERSANLLGMSSRYLRQQLSEDGSSFRELNIEVKLGYANLYLKETPMPLSKIAHKIGFGDQASFTRAYRSWTGNTPGQVRKLSKNDRKNIHILE